MARVRDQRAFDNAGISNEERQPLENQRRDEGTADRLDEKAQGGSDRSSEVDQIEPNPDVVGGKPSDSPIAE